MSAIEFDGVSRTFWARPGVFRRRSIEVRALTDVSFSVEPGELTYIEADSCAETRYTTGQAFVDPGQGHVHSAINRGTAPTVFVATFYDAPAEGSLLIPAEPGDC